MSAERVTALAVVEPGSGYDANRPPDVVIPSPQRNAVLEVAVTGGVPAVTVLDGGSGYVAVPTVTLANVGSGTGATPTATIANGRVTGVTVTGGSNYADSTTASVAAPTGVQATATATIDGGIVDSLTVVGNGTGYAFTPVPTIDPPPELS